jgi:hypothetical protein
MLKRIRAALEWELLLLPWVNSPGSLAPFRRAWSARLL